MFLLGLATTGLLVGLMLGKLLGPGAPGDAQLLSVHSSADGLSLGFDREPHLVAQEVDGAYALLIQAQGQAAQGRLHLASGEVSWQVLPADGGVLLYFVATRPLHAEWHGVAEDGRWRLEIRPLAK